MGTAAFTYIKGQGNHGLDTQSSYPYTARDGSCDSSKTGDDQDICSVVSEYTELPAGDEDSLMDAVANIGPISIAANASPWSSYGGGIFDPSSSSWGEQGYMR